MGDNLAIDATCRVAVVRSSNTFLDVVRLDSGKRTRIPFASTPLNPRPSLVLSNGGRYLAAAREYGFEVWDLSLGKMLFDTEYGGVELASSADGRYFAWREGNDICLFDLVKRTKTGRLKTDDETFLAHTMVFDADGKTLAAHDDERIMYWDLETKKRRGMEFLRKPFAGLKPRPMIPPRSAALLSSEPFLDDARSVRISDITTGNAHLTRKSFQPGEEDYIIALSPDGRVIATGDRVVTLIERDTGKVIGRLPRYHRGLISAMAFSPDGRTLTTGGTDAAVFVWDWQRFRDPVKK